MKSSGIVRCVDELGRIVIPKEMRKKLDITPETPLEISLDGEVIVLKKDSMSCVFCGNPNADTSFKGKPLCTECLLQIRR